MTDELVELMEEPAGGHNHGWTRNDFGSWSSLETGEASLRYLPFTPKNYHGREYGYRQMKCRCILCRAWKAAKNSEYRKRDITSRDSLA